MAIENNRVPRSPWTIKEIAVLEGAMLLVLTIGVVVNNNIALHLSRYIAYALSIYLPIYWTKKKYHLGVDSLGLRKGRHSLTLLVLLGVTAAIIYLVMRASLWDTPSKLSKLSYVHILLLPLSIQASGSILLAPIGEEILYRGLLYSYLRNTRMGLVWGLIIQALLFSLLHFQFHSVEPILNRFVIGIMLGILYETTGSLYPSIICHSLINWFN